MTTFLFLCPVAESFNLYPNDAVEDFLLLLLK